MSLAPLCTARLLPISSPLCRSQTLHACRGCPEGVHLAACTALMSLAQHDTACIAQSPAYPPVLRIMLAPDPPGRFGPGIQPVVEQLVEVCDRTAAAALRALTFKCSGKLSHATAVCSMVTYAYM